MSTTCEHCDGSHHAFKDGKWVRCPTCFPAERKASVEDIPVRFKDLRLDGVKDRMRGRIPEFIKIANTIVAKVSEDKQLKLIPLFIGHEEHTLLLTSAILNSISSSSYMNCSMKTLARLQDAYFNSKAENFYKFCSKPYDCVSIQIGVEIINGASSHVLREFVSERRNKGLHTIVISETHPKDLRGEGYPIEMYKLLSDKLRFLPVEVRFGESATNL